MKPLRHAFSVPPFVCGLAGALLALSILQAAPGLQMELFARGAAHIARLFTGAPVIRIPEGWLLPTAHQNILVNETCSGATFYLIVCALLCLRLKELPLHPLQAIPLGGALALPLAIGINGLRITTLAQVHQWIIPLLPESYGPLAHMMVGVAVFLPSLIALNFCFEWYLLRHPASPSTANA